MAFAASPRLYRFGAFELQLDERRLLSNGTAVLLRPRTFDLLVALADRAGHLVTKDELLDRVWPKMVVEEAALHVQVSALRKLLGAEAIATVSGQGYRFTLPVEQLKSTPRHNLPNQLTSFIGRDQEIAQLKELLATNRLVTLMGAGGAGKTRLALQVAGQLGEEFPEGIWMVELASLSDPGLVTPTVAHTLSQKEQPGKPLIETLIEYLASKNMLLVLDNAEHLLDACVQFVDPALRRSTRLTILVTSRERLGMAGELTFRVPSLTVPAMNETPTLDTAIGYEAVRLFADRARLIQPTFAITAENAAAVASICHRLDGIPLAIELAAPRLRSMTIDELSQRLDQRFALLTDGSRAALPRHRTLRSMIDWSYDLLNEAEQASLRRVSVFAGGWTLARAEAICSGDGIEPTAVIELLASLVDKSLVLAEDRDGATRYRMLETVRQYAHDRLRESGEQAQWQGRHLASFLALAEELFDAPIGTKWRSLIEEVARELDNMRAALAWCVAAKLVDGLRLAVALHRFWSIRARYLTEGREWLEKLLDAMPNEETGARYRARALFAIGRGAAMQGDYPLAAARYRQSVGICREINERRGEAYGLSGLASVATSQARWADAESLLGECTRLARSVDDRGLLLTNLGNLAVVVHARGDALGAFKVLDEASIIARDAADQPEVGGSILGALSRERGRIACKEGMLVLARQSLLESLTIVERLTSTVLTVGTLETFAELALAEHAPARAARIWGSTEHPREELDAPIPFAERADYQKGVAAARAALGDEAFERAWAEGRAMSLDEAVRYARG
jgi:non-specific serine/threonine protein kinase